MHEDRQGNPLPGASARAAAHYDDALLAFNLYRGDPFAALDAMAAEAPDCAMAPIMKAALYALATEPAAAREGRAILDGLAGRRLDEREASHVAAIDAILAGNWSAAARILDRHAIRWPRDLLALQVGHLVDFFRASARSLRDRMARALPAFAGDVPGRSFVLGMYAFGLEESGDYGRAEEAGREACAAEPRDAWAHHAVAHVMEMQGRAADGLAWIEGRAPHWTGDDAFFQVHNWWHMALCHLETDDPASALALYDGPIRGGRSAIAVDLVDASALLWRLAASGIDVGDRWDELSEAWEAHADGHLYPFNDWHAAMAHLGAGKAGHVARILARYREASDADREASAWARETGLPLIEGFAAFHRGDYETAVEALADARHVANTFGGSHAQRDVIDWTMAEAALRGGLRAEAVAFARERLALRPHSPVNARFLRRAEHLAQ